MKRQEFKKMSIRSLVAISTLGALAIGLFELGNPTVADADAGPGVLRFAHTSCVCFAPAQLAIQDGSLQRALDPFGVKLVVSHYDTSPPQTAALASNSLDIGEYGAPPSAALVANQVPVKFFLLSDISDTSEGLVVKSDIHSVADLVGKTIATPLGTSGDFMLHGLLAQHNIPADKVTIVNIAPAALAAAWQRNDIQGAYIWDPFLSIFAQQGGVRLASDGQLVKDSNGKYNAGWDVYVVRSDFAQRYPAIMQAVVKAIDAETQYILGDLSGAAQKLYGPLGVSSADELVSELKADLLLTAAQSKSADWLGSPGQPGRFVDAVYGVWDFLYSHKKVLQPASRDSIPPYIDSSFLP